jgi:hypothetical protein
MALQRCITQLDILLPIRQLFGRHDKGLMLGFSYVKSAAAAASVGLAVCCLHLTAALGVQKPAAALVPPVATVGKARFEGEWTSSGSAVFRGIPYAQPPVGALRWKPRSP